MCVCLVTVGERAWLSGGGGRPVLIRGDSARAWM